MENTQGGGEPGGTRASLALQKVVLDAVLAGSSEPIFVCDRGGVLLYANAAGARHWGRERSEILGTTWGNLGLPDDVAGTLARRCEAVFETGRTLVEEVEFPPGPGGGTWEMRLTRIETDGAGGELAVVALRDVRGRQQAEQALRESEEKYRLLAENSTDMISRHDPEGRYLYVSPASRALTGYEPDELLGRSPYEFIHPEHLFEVNAVHESILKSPDIFTVTFRVRRKDGGTIWLETTARTVRDEATGQILEIQCASRDVTARKVAEDALRESRELLQAILDNSTAVIYVKDADGRYVLVNRWFETLFHLKRNWILGKTDADLFTQAQADAFRANDRAVLESGVPIEFEETVPQDDGIHTYISIKFPIRMSAGAAGAVGGISTEITERKQAEEQLRRQNELLMVAVRSERQAHEALKRAESQLIHAEKLTALGQLVAGIAHEINNPLAFVTSDVTVLKREVGHLRALLHLFLESSDVLAEHRPDLFAAIRERSEKADLPFLLENLDRLMDRSSQGLRRIRKIVKDLRDFARLDEGDLKEVDLNEGVASTVNIVGGRARTKGVQLDTDLQPLPKVACYPGEVNQVVLNLITNAIDATDAGGRVTVRTRPVPDGVEIQVLDTGPGIDPSIRHKIFDPFFTTKKVGEGTGLGLSISDGIIRAHGGTIDVESEPGRGACFTVRLPLAARGTAPRISLPL